MKKLLCMTAAAQLLAQGAALAAETEAPPPGDDGPIVAAIKNGKPILDVRYRFEWKDQDGFAEEAYANTLRTRLGFETGEFFHFKALVEFENVLSIGDDHFNSTTNGRTQFPVIADPDATEVNRAQVTFTGIEKTAVTVGRQRFNLANQRFVGAVDFRQNQQTFDAARVTLGIFENVTADYAYVSRVHRIFGDDHPAGEFESDSHIMAVEADAGKLGKLTGYGLLLDFENAAALSSATWGVRYENAFPLGGDVKLLAAGEYASQRDYGANPFDYREDYIHGEGGLAYQGFAVKGGYESLGGDGVIGFSTPLATLHKFQGFADVFLATPAVGVEDIYGTASYAVKDGPFGAGWKFFATYHEFESELGSADFGNEIDFGLAVDFAKHWSVEAKAAIYDGAGGFADRNLAWFSLRFQY